MVRPDQRHFPDSCRLAVPEQRQPQFHYAGKQQRWRSRLGFALAGSIRFANADPNSYRYIHADTDADSYSYIHANAHAYGHSYVHAYTDFDANTQRQRRRLPQPPLLHQRLLQPPTINTYDHTCILPQHLLLIW